MVKGSRDNVIYPDFNRNAGKAATEQEGELCYFPRPKERHIESSSLEKKLISEQDLKLIFKFREVSKLENRIKRYQKRLIYAALNSGINFEVKVPDLGDSYYDVSPIIEVAKELLPSLYRRYYESLNKYSRNMKALEILVAKQTSSS